MKFIKEDLLDVDGKQTFKVSILLSVYLCVFLKVMRGTEYIAYHTISILLTACVDACSHMYKIYMIFYSFGFNTFSFLAFYKSNISAIRLLRKTSRFPASHAYVAVAERIKSPLDGEYYLVQNDFVLWIRREFISIPGSHKCIFSFVLL